MLCVLYEKGNIMQVAVNSIQDITDLAKGRTVSHSEEFCSKTATFKTPDGQVDFVQYDKGYPLVSQARAVNSDGDIFIRTVTKSGEVRQNLVRNNGEVTKFSGSEDAIAKGVRIFNEFVQKITGKQ